MSEGPWLTILGLGEDGPDGLPPASRAALDAAEVIIGPPRHLALIPETQQRRVEWPAPFADGLSILTELRGQRVVALASGNPFWFGAGRAISRVLSDGEWQAFPAPSTFALAAARLGWPLEDTLCLGLHAAPLARLRRHMAPGRKAIVLLRDGAAIAELAGYLRKEGFGRTEMITLQSLGGPHEEITRFPADAVPSSSFRHPVAVAIEIAGGGSAIPVANGIDDALFQTDGQITKRPVRALTLSALSPRPGEHLWDIGGGSGSISVEWCLSDPSLRATSIEARSDRASLIRANAAQFGLAGLDVVEGYAPAALDSLEKPDAVFIGGGLSEDLLDDLESRLLPGTRIVANAVTLESETLIAAASARLGGMILKICLSEAIPLGNKRGWKSSYQVIQWSVIL